MKPHKKNCGCLRCCMYGDIELVPSPDRKPEARAARRSRRVLVNPTPAAQEWAAQKYFTKKNWQQFTRCIRNLIRFQEKGEYAPCQ